MPRKEGCFSAPDGLIKYQGKHGLPLLFDSKAGSEHPHRISILIHKSLAGVHHDSPQERSKMNRKKRLRICGLPFLLPGSLRWMAGGQANANHLRCIPVVQVSYLDPLPSPRPALNSQPPPNRKFERCGLFFLLPPPPPCPPHSRSRKKDRDMYSFRYTSFTDWEMIHLSLSFSAFNGSERLRGTGGGKGEDNVLMKKKLAASFL